jgi:hypothetical protein
MRPLLSFLLFVVLAVGLGALLLWGLGYIGVPDILYRVAFVAIVVGVILAIVFRGYRTFGGDLNV